MEAEVSKAKRTGRGKGLKKWQQFAGANVLEDLQTELKIKIVKLHSTLKYELKSILDDVIDDNTIIENFDFEKINIKDKKVKFVAIHTFNEEYGRDLRVLATKYMISKGDMINLLFYLLNEKLEDRVSI